MSIALVVTAGPHAGRSFRFDRHDTFLVGRSPEAHLSLPDDPYFSRMHFLVEVNPPLCRLSDLNSRNGTLVNGVRVKTVELRDEDEIRGGQTALRVNIAREGAATLDLPPTPADPNAMVPPPEGPARAFTAPRREVPETGPAKPGEGTAAPLSFPDPVGAPAETCPVLPGFGSLERVGQGAMGVVYRAVRLADGREVAVKVIRPAGIPDVDLVARFLREAAILEQLSHPHIVSWLGSGQSQGLLYFAMEFVKGTDGARLVRAEGPLAIGRAVRLVLPLLQALDYAHARGFVHRDIKPANLLVSCDGGEQVKVADFGLARAYQDSPLSGLTLSGMTAGTPHFMSPEQVTDFRGARPPADQYSAAATFYYLLTGQTVHEAGYASDLFRQLLTEAPIPLRSRRPDVPTELERVVHRALARRPEERFADVRALARALQPFA